MIKNEWLYDPEQECLICSSCNERALTAYNDVIDLYEDLLTPYCPFCGQKLSEKYRKVVCNNGTTEERIIEN